MKTEQSKAESVEEAVIRASFPKHESFIPFIFNDKPDKPLGWDESIEFAQSNYCSLDPRIDNTPRQMREKAISAWSYQAGANWQKKQDNWISVGERLPDEGTNRRCMGRTQCKKSICKWQI
jgi:hypothetical protein